MTEWTGTADLHLHTHHSDGAPSVRALLEHVATATTLNVIAITDHDTIAGAREAQTLMRQTCYPFDLIMGEEISTRDGHLVGLFLHERIPPRMSARETVAAIHAQGGLAFAPHPFFRARQREGQPVTMIGLGPAIRALTLDAIETINATPFLAIANRHAQAYNKTTTGLPALGNSDGHILAAVGKGYTRFPGTTARELQAAIQDGRSVASAHPYTMRELLAYLRFWLRRRPAFVPQRFDRIYDGRDTRAAS
jgi:predicted metal-dependent phosphoesterase TrpH